MKINGEPKTEQDLLRLSEYEKFYYRIGLGAPVTAEVTVDKGLFRKSKYTFDYTIKGNSISLDKVTQITDKYSKYCKCDAMNQDLEQGITTMIYLFSNNDKAYEMYSCLDGKCNVGVKHGYSPAQGKYIVVVEHHEIRGVL